MRRGCDGWLETAADDAVMAITLAVPRRPHLGRIHAISSIRFLVDVFSLLARERSMRVRSRAFHVLLFEPTCFRASGAHRRTPRRRRRWIYREC
jgi:hypothetical protein